MNASTESSRDLNNFSAPKSGVFDNENSAPDGQSDTGLTYDQSKAAIGGDYSKGGDLSGFSELVRNKTSQ